MKNFKMIFMIFLVSSIIFMISCPSCNESGDDETGYLNVPEGNGTLTVNATYTGTAKAGEAGVSDGTGRIFVYLYSELGTAKDQPVYQADTASEAAVGTQYTITKTGIAPAGYYVMIFYDYKHHNQSTAGKADRYILYDNTGSKSAASQAAVAGQGTTTINAAFGDAYQLQDSGAYLP